VRLSRQQPDGVRFEHFKAFLNAPQALARGLAPLVSALAAGDLPDEAVDVIRGGTLTPLGKPGSSKPRPVVPLHPVRKLAAKALLNAHKQALRDRLLPLQVGVNVSDAAISAAQAIDVAIHDRPHYVVVACDFSDAFQRAEAVRGVEEADRHEPLRGFARSTAQLLNRPSELSVKGSAQKVQSGRGFPQGCPSSPAGFALSIQQLVEEVSAASHALTSWFLDDCTIVGPPDDALAAYETLKQRAAEPRFGLALNKSKTVVWSPQAPDEQLHRFDCAKLNDDGIRILGSPVGTDTFKHRFLSHKVKEWKELTHLVTSKLSNSQDKHLILLKCLHKQPSHLARSVPPEVATPVLHEYDRFLASTWFSEVAGLPSDTAELHPQALHQFQLPVALGGLGFTPWSELAPCAFAAAWMGHLSLTHRILSQPDASSLNLADTLEPLFDQERLPAASPLGEHPVAAAREARQHVDNLRESAAPARREQAKLGLSVGPVTDPDDMRGRDGEEDERWKPAHYRHRLPTWSECAKSSRPLPFLQRTFSEFALTESFNALWSSSSKPAAARLLSSTGTFSKGFFQEASAEAMLGVKDGDFQGAAALRLGLAQLHLPHDEFTCPCGAAGAAEDAQAHFLGCPSVAAKAGPQQFNWRERHNAIRDTILEQAEASLGATRKEPSPPHPQRPRERLDFAHPASSRGVPEPNGLRRLYGDVVVTAPTQATQTDPRGDRRSSVRSKGATCEDADQRKRRRYRQSIHSPDSLLPIAVEAFGTTTTSVCRYLSDLAATDAARAFPEKPDVSGWDTNRNLRQRHRQMVLHRLTLRISRALHCGLGSCLSQASQRMGNRAQPPLR